VRVERDRCDGIVKLRSLTIRASDDHSRQCQRRGKYYVGWLWLCYQHIPQGLARHAAMRSHYAIVERIRAIPARALDV
jgi:hypothetical protein